VLKEEVIAMTNLDELKQQLRPGQVYRRAELSRWSNAIDRHLQQLVSAGVLVKLSGGLYHYPKKTVFGAAPAEDQALVRAFLKDNRFILTSPNAYNALGVGTTQLSTKQSFIITSVTVSISSASAYLIFESNMIYPARLIKNFCWLI
jgi:hypothetical protein